MCDAWDILLWVERMCGPNLEQVRLHYGHSATMLHLHITFYIYLSRTMATSECHHDDRRHQQRETNLRVYYHALHLLHASVYCTLSFFPSMYTSIYIHLYTFMARFIYMIWYIVGRQLYAFIDVRGGCPVSNLCNNSRTHLHASLTQRVKYKKKTCIYINISKWNI